ncbi:unnamed protein product [Parajaminaea phylloscopi]
MATASTSAANINLTHQNSAHTAASVSASASSPPSSSSPSSSSDSRIRSPLRQNGFTVHGSDAYTAHPASAATQQGPPNHLYLGSTRSRTSTTSSTVTLREHAIGMSSSAAATNATAPSAAPGAAPNGHYAGPASAVTLTARAADGDVEMGDALADDKTGLSAPQPLPIPRNVNEPRSIGATSASQTPSEVATPPDVASTSLAGLKTPSSSTSARSSAARLPTVSALSPQFRSRNSYGHPPQTYGAQTYGAGVRSGSISGSNGGAFPTHYSSLASSGPWSPHSHSTDPHLYSISSSSHVGSYPYSTAKPYLSTSFKTSAERSGSSLLDDDDDDNDDDVFGEASSSLWLQEEPHRGRARGARGAPSVDEEMDGDGDASGVFSFSSPYLRPRSIDDQIPGLPPSPPEGGHPPGAPLGGSGAPPDRVLSPTVTARSLQKLSLGGGGGVDMTNSPSSSGMNGGGGGGGVGASRRSRPSLTHHSYSQTNPPSAYSRSLPSGSAAFHQSRRLSFGRLARPVMAPSANSAYSISPSGVAASFGNATLYSRSPSGNSPYGRSPAVPGGYSRASPYSAASAGRVPTTFAMEVPSHRERSRSRQRWATPRGPQAQLPRGRDEEEDDEDATDDEMVVDANGSQHRPPAFEPSSMPGTSSLAAMAAAAAAAAAAVEPTPPPPSTIPRPNGVHATVEEEEDDGVGPPPDEMTQVAAIRDRLGGAANCAAFIAKLWFLVVRPARYGKYLHWNSTGTTVILSTDTDISNEFASDVLPRLWNHANYSSFIRQMNLYGFQRLPSSRIIDKDEIKAANDAGMKGPDGRSPTELSTAQQLYGSHSSFLHPKFVRGREDLLPLLKPRNAKRPKAAASDKREDLADADE